MVKKIPAIIPARGGSKGLPRKNVLDICGKPMIAWTIKAALDSKHISDVIVSTDDEEIAKISENWGAQIPFMRPSELAKDDSISIDTYLYTIKKLNSEFNKSIEEFIVLQPTSPLRTSQHVDEAIELFFEKSADSVLSFYENPHPVNWIKIIDKRGFVKDYQKVSKMKNRQDFEKTYIPNGAIVIIKYQLLKEFRTYYFKKTLPYIMEKENSIDIDDEFDFRIAEYLLNKIPNNK